MQLVPPSDKHRRMRSLTLCQRAQVPLLPPLTAFGRRDDMHGPGTRCVSLLAVLVSHCLYIHGQHRARFPISVSTSSPPNVGHQQVVAAPRCRALIRPAVHLQPLATHLDSQSSSPPCRTQPAPAYPGSSGVHITPLPSLQSKLLSRTYDWPPTLFSNVVEYLDILGPWVPILACPPNARHFIVTTTFNLLAAHRARHHACSSTDCSA
ncbi:hypothetical protein PHLGIDRAFT_291871 [Phlebiopsis gigantea 11061_1 CR5-6]|uniref:Uncharacterized protein n=1 Tax=Phlebiopsis gigantea (strain 11061_1 CR5-6) TaxID=745531 RepID=A0A0C3S0J6_PHLG1|nr:hypothetical protein PHLGIDRAFT_291871 [Phlebiopsis gigantea 11061_1 CR5-6]